MFLMNFEKFNFCLFQARFLVLVIPKTINFRTDKMKKNFKETFKALFMSHNAHKSAYNDSFLR